MPKSKTKSYWGRYRQIDYWLYGLAFGPFLTLLVIIALQKQVPVLYIVHDPLTAAEIAGSKCCNVSFGLLSNIGVIAWTSTSAACLFAALVLVLHNGERADWAFLGSAGFLTGWLMLDDLFLVHERVLPAIGVPQIFVYGFYGLLVLAYLWCQRHKILEVRFDLLALAFILLSASVLSDVVWKGPSAVRLLFEDGTKLLGIGAWAAFHLEAALVLLGQHFQTYRDTQTG